MLEDLTGRAALAFDNARLYAERARVAQTLRRSLMPAALPTVPGLDLDCYFRPMDAGSEVGGDFYDVFADRDGCWLVVGDVCGKGAEAAVITAFLRHTTVAYAREGERPATVLERVNRAMLEQDFDGRFATAILARLDFAPRRRRADGRRGRAPAGARLASERRHRGARHGRHAARHLPGRAYRRVLHRARRGRLAGALHRRPGRGAGARAAAQRRADDRPRSRRTPPRPPGETISTLLGLVDLTQGARDDIAILVVRIAAAQSRGVRAA